MFLFGGSVLGLWCSVSARKHDFLGFCGGGRVFFPRRPRFFRPGGSVVCRGSCRQPLFRADAVFQPANWDFFRSCVFVPCSACPAMSPRAACSPSACLPRSPHVPACSRHRKREKTRQETRKNKAGPTCPKARGPPFCRFSRCRFADAPGRLGLLCLLVVFGAKNVRKRSEGIAIALRVSLRVRQIGRFCSSACIDFSFFSAGSSALLCKIFACIGLYFCTKITRGFFA